MKGIASSRITRNIPLAKGYSIEISVDREQVFIAKDDEYIGDLFIVPISETEHRVGFFSRQRWESKQEDGQP